MINVTGCSTIAITQVHIVLIILTTATGCSAIAITPIIIIDITCIINSVMHFPVEPTGLHKTAAENRPHNSPPQHLSMTVGEGAPWELIPSMECNVHPGRPETARDAPGIYIHRCIIIVIDSISMDITVRSNGPDMGAPLDLVFQSSIVTSKHYCN